jgi:hypothetical protein
LCTIVQSLHEFVDVIDGWGFTEESLSLLVEFFRLLFDVFFFTEVEQLALFWNCLPE